MLNWLISFIKRLFGSQSDRQFKRTMPKVDEINKLSAQYQSLSDAELRAKTAGFRQDLKTRNADNQQTLDEITESLRGDLDGAERERLNDQYDELDKAIRNTEAAFLEEILPQAFAMVVDTCRRLLGR
ncbi:MAG TPA: preprotein translocase subunit SecA, partial [Candidatus Latescibacteria bacterium]|nr:preprotein translocase subunit SecA [Candidatus Latescibacterota bacterium]